MWVNYPNMPTGANASLELFGSWWLSEKTWHRYLPRQPYSMILNDRPLSIMAVPGAKIFASS